MAEADEEFFLDPKRICRELKPFRFCVGYLTSCLLSLIIIYILNAVLVSPWPPKNNFGRCETVIPDQLLREPWNAISNLGYVWAGGYTICASLWDMWFYPKLMRVWREKASEEAQDVPRAYTTADLAGIGFSLGIGECLVGISSFRYHACGGCSGSGFYDVYAIYVTVAYLIFSAVLIFFCMAKCITPYPGDRNRLIVINVFYFALFIANAILWLDYQDLIEAPLGGIQNTKFLLIGLFAFLVATFTAAIVIARCRKLTPNYDYVAIPTLVFFLSTGLLSWAPEEIFSDCSPVEGDFFFQLHAYWHVALSIALLATYVYLRSVGNKTVQFQGGLKGHFCLKEIGDFDSLEVIPRNEEKPEL